MNLEKVGKDRGGAAEELTARGIRKGYGGRLVVSDVSVRVRPGEVVGLLGPNGAGKTTSFYMIVGLVRPDFGVPLRRTLQRPRQPRQPVRKDVLFRQLCRRQVLTVHHP